MTKPPDRYLGQFRPAFSKLHQDRDLYWAIPFSAPKVFVVLGKRFAGVGEVIEYLRARHGILTYTLGGELRRIAEERGVQISHRRYLQDLGDEFRTEANDAGILARRVLRRVRAENLRQPPWSLPRSIVIGGIKTPEELEIIEKVRHFKPLLVEVSDDDLRFKRAETHGDLEEEYEADLRRRTASGQEVEATSWADLDLGKRRKYFDDLDRIHLDGHPGSCPVEFKGAPARVIAELQDPLVIPNDFESIGPLHRKIDELLRVNRPAHQVVRQ